MKEQEEIEAKQEELSDQIVVNVRFLAEDKQAWAKLQVSLNDNINNLKDFY